jgi:Mrp family chromosome partitioning ATPase
MTIADLELELIDINLQITDAREADPAIRELRASFDTLKNNLVDLFARAADASFDEQAAILAELRTVEAELGVLQDVFAIQDSETLGDLLAERTRVQARLDDLTERRDQIEVDISLLASPVQVASPAITATPVPSNVPRLLLAGVFLGGLLGSGVAYLLALRRRTFVDRNQPEVVLDAPLIAAVPNFRQEGIRTSLPVRDAPHSVSAEAFRFAAGALDLSRSTPAGTIITQGKVVALASADVSEGKTVAACNIALAAARVGKRVLLIDGDFGNQVATELLADGTRAAAGITEVVESGVALSKAVVPVEGTGSTGLHLLSRGWSSTTAPEFFRLPATREFLEQVQDYYDLVLVDAPPLLHVAYASVLLELVDRVLVVVRHESSASDLEDFQDRLDLIGTPTVGYLYNLTPLRTDLSRGQGSARDVLGTAEPPQGEESSSSV